MLEPWTRPRRMRTHQLRRQPRQITSRLSSADVASRERNRRCTSPPGLLRGPNGASAIPELPRPRTIGSSASHRNDSTDHGAAPTRADKSVMLGPFRARVLLFLAIPLFGAEVSAQ